MKHDENYESSDVEDRRGERSGGRGFGGGGALAPVEQAPVAEPGRGVSGGPVSESATESRRLLELVQARDVEWGSAEL